MSKLFINESLFDKTSSSVPLFFKQVSNSSRKSRSFAKETFFTSFVIWLSAGSRLENLKITMSKNGLSYVFTVKVLVVGISSKTTYSCDCDCIDCMPGDFNRLGPKSVSIISLLGVTTSADRAGRIVGV